MASIHEITTQGQADSIGPVKITKTYPVGGSGAKASLFLLVEDATGKGALKIWGAAASCGAKEGDIITVRAAGPRGKIEMQEYNGKSSINANDCNVTIGDGSAGASSSNVSPVTPVASTQYAPVKPAADPVWFHNKALAHKEIYLAVRGAYDGIEIPAESMCAIATSLFIEGNKSGKSPI